MSRTKLLGTLASALATLFGAACGGSSNPSSGTASRGATFYWVDRLPNSNDSRATNRYFLVASDGSSRGTRLLGEMPPSFDLDFPGNVAASERGSLFFWRNLSGLPKLWTTDGSAPPHMVRAFNEGNTPEMLNHYSMHYSTEPLAHFTSLTASAGRQLWESDGTLEGTRAIQGVDHLVIQARAAVSQAGRSFLLNQQPTNQDLELISISKAQGIQRAPVPRFWRLGVVYVSVVQWRDTPLIRESAGLWWGAPDTGRLVFTLPAGDKSLFANMAVNDDNPAVFFSVVAQSSGTGGWSLWRADATGAALIQSFPRLTTSDKLAATSGSLFFSYCDPNDAPLPGGSAFLPSCRMWVNTAAGGSRRVETPSSFDLNSRTVALGRWLLFEQVRAQGLEIWRTDGTQEATSGLASGTFETSGVAGGRVVFAEQARGADGRYWSSDGTPDGTWRLPRACPRPLPSTATLALCLE